MNRKRGLILLALLAFASIGCLSNADSKVKVNYNDVEILVNSKLGSPYISEQGITMMPLEGFMQFYGTVIEDVKDTDHLMVIKGALKMEFIPNEKHFYKNGFKMPLSTEAIRRDNVIYFPLRDLMEMLGEKVSWDGASRTVIIESDPEMVSTIREKLKESPELVFETVVIEQRIEFVWPEPSNVDFYILYIMSEEGAPQKVSGLVLPEDSSHYRSGYFDASPYSDQNVIHFKVSSVVDGVESELSLAHEVYLK